MAKPGYMMIQGDASRIPLPDKSVHCVVTSPPYFNLRGVTVPGELGSEATPKEYVEHIVKIFREVRRVLRDDGVLMLNLGDSYANKGRGPRNPDKWPKQSRNDHIPPRTTRQKGIAAKNRLGIPHQVVLALQEDGWIWRDEIIWEKPSPMPSPALDRTVLAHEFVFILSKKPRYYFDAEAIKEDSDYGDFKRNSRSVWRIPSSNYKGAHFSTMPPRLAAKLIQAGSSEHGVCSKCGAPYKRDILKTRIYRQRPNSLTKRTGEVGTGNYCANDVAGVKTETIGWKPSCTCRTAKCESCGTDFWSEPRRRAGGDFFLQDVQNGIQGRAKKQQEVLLPGVSRESEQHQDDRGSEAAPAEAEGADSVRVVRREFHAKKQEQQVLLETVFGTLDCPKPEKLSGLVQDQQGIHSGVCSESSIRQQDRLHDAASDCDGGNYREAPEAGRGGTSQEQDKGRQSAGEPGDYVEIPARQTSQVPQKLPIVSVLRSGNEADQLCLCCGGNLSWEPCVPIPSTVLDVFGGSGTTVAEANRLGRSGITMDLNADYLKLAEERIKKARIKAGLDVDAEKYPIIAEIERRREAS